MILPVAVALDRCILEFRGQDVVRFLNGQLSNNVRKLQPESALHACVMTAKGRMNAEVWLTKRADSVFVDGPTGMGDALLARFERYIISDDVAVEDVTEKWRLHHILGGLDSGVSSQRFNEDGHDLWQLRDQPQEKFTRLLTGAEAESLRIEHGVPAWGSELDEGTIPVEAGLDRDSIDYHKGCYIGQEVISRIKSVGHVNRLLVRLRGGKEPGLARGQELFADGVSVGAITSAAMSLDLENNVALAYVKRGFSAPGTLLHSSNPDGEIHPVLSLHP